MRRCEFMSVHFLLFACITVHELGLATDLTSSDSANNPSGLPLAFCGVFEF